MCANGLSSQTLRYSMFCKTSCLALACALRSPHQVPENPAGQTPSDFGRSSSHTRAIFFNRYLLLILLILFALVCEIGEKSEAKYCER